MHFSYSLNWPRVAFAIVGAVLSLSPELLGNAIVVIGLAVLLANAFIFGYFAECIQRNLNTKNAETAIAETKDAVKPYFDAYDAMLHCYDEHYSAEESVFRREFQGAFDNLQEKYIAYLEWQKDREPRYAKRTKFAIGYWYFALFAFGLLIIGTGLVLKYNSSMQMWITGLFIK